MNKKRDTKGIEVNEISETTKKSMIDRFAVAFILAILCVPSLILGDIFVFIFIFVIAILSVYEITKAPTKLGQNKYKRVIFIFSYFMMIVLIYWIFLKNNFNNFINNQFYKISLINGFNKPQISISGYCLCVLFFFFMTVIDKNFKITDAFYFIVILFIVSFGLQCFLYLRYFPFVDAGVDNSSATQVFKYWQSAGLLLFVILGAITNDIGAYFIGILFGKNHLTPISPKKTIEGFVGGIIISSIVSFVFATVMDLCGLPILSFLDLKHWWNILILSLSIPFVGTMGDLTFSAVKRHYGVKDFGTILSSMGGILDRIDSILFSTITTSLIVYVMSLNWIIV